MTKIQMTKTALSGKRFRACKVGGLILSSEHWDFEFVQPVPFRETGDFDLPAICLFTQGSGK